MSDVKEEEEKEKESGKKIDILCDHLSINFVRKFHTISRYTEGRDFIFFKGKAYFSNIDVMIMVLKSSDPTNIEENKHLKTILKVKHRNLMQIHEVNFNTYPYYIVTEFVSGVNLEVLLKKIGPLPLHNVKRLLNIIGDVMNTLRKKKFPLAGLRPSKIIIDQELEPEISPFELLIARNNNRLFQRFIEECHYFSPETLNDLETNRGSDLNDKSNQFCLATIGFEMLTGEKLFKGETAEEILLIRHRFFTDKVFRNNRLVHPRLTKKMSNILKKMLRFDSEDRYDNMAMALRVIDRVRADFDKDELHAFNSYRRSLEYNDDFVELFYENLFAHPNSYFTKPETEEELEKLHQKFFLDLHLFFDVENAIESLDNMATTEEEWEQINGGLIINPVSEYLLFLDVFMTTIQECDPRYKSGSVTKKAWFSIKNRILKALKEKELLLKPEVISNITVEKKVETPYSSDTDADAKYDENQLDQED